MLERYSLGKTPEQLADFFSVDPYGFEKPRYNAAPGQLLPVITTNSPGLSHFYWGTAPQWSKNKSISEKLINVRVEQMEEKATLKKKVKKFRCIVPADGFYGWKKIGKKSAVPYRFRLGSGALFAMAALWEEYEDENDEAHHTFSIITRASVSGVNEISERMPVILADEERVLWLDQETEETALFACLQGSPPQLDSYTISPRINSLEVDEASLILPAPAADQWGNLTLFN